MRVFIYLIILKRHMGNGGKGVWSFPLNFLCKNLELFKLLEKEHYLNSRPDQ